MKYVVVALFILTLTVYAWTTSPYLQAGDSAEMTAAAITLGVPHQPSYPLFVGTGYIFTRLPIPYIPEKIHIPGISSYTNDKNTSKYIYIYRTAVASAFFQAIANCYFFCSRHRTLQEVYRKK